MIRKVILLTAVMITLCLTVGCQKPKAENTPEETDSSNGIKINNEAVRDSNSGETESASAETGESSGLNISLDENRIIQDQSFQVE